MLLSHVPLETIGCELDHADPPHRALLEVPLDRFAGRLAHSPWASWLRCHVMLNPNSGLVKREIEPCDILLSHRRKPLTNFRLRPMAKLCSSESSFRPLAASRKKTASIDLSVGGMVFFGKKAR